MDASALDRFLALNRHLESVVAAGVPLDLDGEDAIRHYDASVAIEMGRGRTFAAAVTENSELPPPYRSAMLAFARSGDATAALTALDSEAAGSDSRSNWSWSALIPLIVLAVLATVAVTYFAWIVWPAFTSVYVQLDVEPPWGGQLLWLPVGTFITVAFVLLLLWRFRRLSGRERGTLHRGSDASRHARFADVLARLLTDSIPPADAIELVGEAAGDKQLGAAATTIAAAYRDGRNLDPGRSELATLPPLLRWALTRNSDPAPAELAAELRFIADFYRRSAGCAARRWRIAVPTVITALLGGAIVLTYGLLVFTPIIQLLEDLAR